MTEKTIFKKIIDKEIPAKIVYEDDLCLAFYDVMPQAPVHFLVIPKKEIASVSDIGPEDGELIGHLFAVIGKLAAQLGIAEEGYRVVSNCGVNACQTVKHLHFHVMGGRPFGWPPG
ncbi:MAG: histidine triad nucleotide-binding protein [Planctomycetia bacterium]|nr:histidine triad nucleotide-binding protein [Planctomycetia bacterium]